MCIYNGGATIPKHVTLLEFICLVVTLSLSLMPGGRPIAIECDSCFCCYVPLSLACRIRLTCRALAALFVRCFFFREGGRGTCRSMDLRRPGYGEARISPPNSHQLVFLYCRLSSLILALPALNSAVRGLLVRRRNQTDVCSLLRP